MPARRRAPSGCGPQARWRCCSLLTYRRGYARRSRLASGAWGPAAKCHPILAQALLVPLLAVVSCQFLVVTPFLEGSPLQKENQSGAPTPESEPFLPGEKLTYRIEWNPPWYLFFLPTMDAGEVELSIDGDTTDESKRTFKIVFHARSSGSLAKLAGLKVDDRFEFTTDRETLCTSRVFKKELEGKRQREITVIYYPEKKQLHIREMDLAHQPAKVLRDEFVNGVPVCVKDLFSALYWVRRNELNAKTTHRLIVGDNARVKEVEVRVEKAELIQTPPGKFDTWKINTVAVLGGLFKDGGQFSFWLTNDRRKLPVRFEVQVKLGKVTGKLKAMENIGAVRKPNSVSPR